MPFGFFRNTLTAVMCMCQAFRVQLYWEQGYIWQDKDYEYEQFCWMHSYDGYPGYGKCYYGTESGPCIEDAVYIAECNHDQRQQWTFVELRNGEFQIKAVSNNKCMERIGWDTIRMRDCNSNTARQRWFAPGASTRDRKFPISQGSSNQCIGQLHHPKSGEELEMEGCKTSLQSDTLYWEKQ